MMSANKVKWVRLGDYIELCSERNSEGIYFVEDVVGISTEKKFIPTKANMDGVSVSSYKVVHPFEFAYVADTSRRGEKIALALNTTKREMLISSIYTTFRSIDATVLNPEYLYLIMSRPEFDRYCRFNSWGSARETFDWSEMCRVRLPLPSIDVQRELVDTYNGLKALAEQNEAVVASLAKMCEGLVVEAGKKYETRKLGELITEYNVTNKDNSIKIVKSVSVTKEFKDTGAKVNKDELSKYKIVPPSYISYVQTTKNEKCFACAINNFGEDIVVTSVNKVIGVKNEKVLDSHYLFLFLRRTEFDRYAIFNSWGSAREIYQYDDLLNVDFPLPPIEVQRSIANLYHCMEEAKSIAATARERLKALCPALVLRGANA